MGLWVPLDLPGPMDPQEIEACLACPAQLALLDPEELQALRGREEMLAQLGRKVLQVKKI